MNHKALLILVRNLNGGIALNLKMFRKSSTVNLPVTISAFIFLCAIVRMITIYAGGDSKIVTHVGDDTFYYFVMAENFAKTGHWSFDGVAPATGFHLLWGYILAAAYKIYPNATLKEMFLLSSLMGAACFSASAWFMSRSVRKWYGDISVLSVLFIFSTTASFRIVTMGMEAPFVILFASIVIFVTVGASGGSVALRCGVAFLAGLFGMLSRSDFGILPLMIFIVFALQAFVKRTSVKDGAAVAFAALAGSVVGLVVVLAHCYIISGGLFQNSARMKAYWSQLAGHKFASSLVLWAQTFSSQPFLTPKIGFAMLGLICVVSAVTVQVARLNRIPVIIGLLVIAGYICFYRYNSEAAQIWYLACFIPATILVAAPVMKMFERWRISLSIAMILWAVVGLFHSFSPPWPHQITYREAGLYLRAHPEIVRVGIWNAGIVRYFAGRSITNLDGLVNDDILPYAQSGRLADYILKRRLTHIMDHPIMFDRRHSLRGGYADGHLAKCLNRIRSFGDGTQSQTFEGTPTTLYRVDPLCLGHDGT